MSRTVYQQQSSKENVDRHISSLGFPFHLSPFLLLQAHWIWEDENMGGLTVTSRGNPAESRCTCFHFHCQAGGWGEPYRLHCLRGWWSHTLLDSETPLWLVLLKKKLWRLSHRCTCEMLCADKPRNVSSVRNPERSTKEGHHRYVIITMSNLSR